MLVTMGKAMSHPATRGHTACAVNELLLPSPATYDGECCTQTLHSQTVCAVILASSVLAWQHKHEQLMRYLIVTGVVRCAAARD
jgi:hypothetical protein